MKRGFTILELLVASALTAVLLLAVFHVIGSLGHSRAELALQANTGGWQSDLLDLLRRDLVNSTAIDFHRDGFTLTGHGALNRNTLACTHEPVTVKYEITTIHGRSWLVRTQSSRITTSRWTELLCPDVEAFTVRSASLVAATQTDSDTQGATVPPVVRVQLDSIIDQILVLR